MKRTGRAVELRAGAKGRAARRTRRSVSIAPPKAGRGTECARSELAMRGASAARRQSPEWAETLVLMMTIRVIG